MKKICILKGSPRKNGNTAAMVEKFVAEAERKEYECVQFELYDMEIGACSGCRACQKDPEGFGCYQNDDMHAIFKEVLACDLLVLATPIHSWYCTPPMKAVMDRLVFGMNKYYTDGPKNALWSGKKVVLITACGYRPEQGADLWEEGIRRYCKHSQMEYCGMLAQRFLGFETENLDKDKEKLTGAFTEGILKKMEM